MRTMKSSIQKNARCISRAAAHGGLRSRRGAAPAGLLFAALLSHAPATASVTIQSFSVRPAAPTTGDPVILSAVVQSTSSCDFIGAAIGFGPQPELGGQSGWAITLDFRDGDLPVVSTCPIEKNFGALPMAEGDGVLRARNNGTVPDAMWVEETSRFVQEAELGQHMDAQAAVFRRAAGGGRSLMGEALALLAAALGALPRAGQGLIISRRFYDRLGGHRTEHADPERDLLRRIGRRRLVTLGSSVSSAS